MLYDSDILAILEIIIQSGDPRKEELIEKLIKELKGAKK